MAGVLLRKLRTLTSLPVFTLVWVVPVWILLGLCRLAILTVPLRRMAPFYGDDIGICPWVPLASPGQIARARDIRRTIGLAAGYSPWTANCYPQALAARVMMRLYGVPHAIHFGLRREAEGPEAGGRDGEGREIAAHAWVVCGPVPVTGGHSFGLYTVVRSFAARGLLPSTKQNAPPEG